MRVTLLDYGVGNIHSLRKALERARAEVHVTKDPKDVLAAEAIVLPGVGAFGEAAPRLKPLAKPLLARLEEGTPLLGVCLGMQLLFEASEESPGDPGLAYMRGKVKRLAHDKLPHIGWNVLAFREDDLFAGLSEGTHVYYVNSFAPAPEEPVTVATTTYGSTFTAVVRKRNAWGTQFHPEKSGAAGLKMIDNFVRYAEAWR
ncbi:MAG TPA: imidazole glycerol phosphate synthase subunit HisH [Candidatus Thermoplasmatota archaeon]|nr:imidazole glycerol phosphate synthase subunit HisH [Candidatus Thermoplasmatota archaeon]